MKPWRQIVSRSTAKTEHTSVRSRTFTWWVSFSTTLKLECGHEKVISSYSEPKHRVRCKECPDVGVEASP